MEVEEEDSGDDEKPLLAMKRPAAKKAKGKDKAVPKKRANKQDDAKVKKKRATSTKHDEDVETVATGSQEGPSQVEKPAATGSQEAPLQVEKLSSSGSSD